MGEIKEKTRKLKKNFFPVIMISFAMSFMLMIYEPTVLYFQNKGEFWYDLYLLFPIILSMFLIVFLFSVLVFGIIYVLSKKIYFPAVVGYTIVYLCTYVQGNYLVGHLPPLDGSPVDWAMYDYQRAHTIILWVVVTAIVLLIIKYAKKASFFILVNYISGGITLMLLITMIVVCIDTNGLEHKKDMSVSTNYEFDMSTEQNFVILILDSVDGKRMSDMMELHPEYKETFSDFTCYDNTMSGYPFTLFSIPYIISGDWFECDELIDPYIVKAYKDAELFKELEARDYRMGLYVEEAPLADESMFRFENIVEDTGEFASIYDFVKLELRMVGLKYAPYDLKRRCMMLPEEIINLRKKRNDIERVEFYNSNIQFYKDIQEKEIVLGNEKCFRLIHIKGAHGPFCYDTNVNIIENGTYDQSIEASMTIVDAYLQKLKDYGVYDNTAIMIMSDHGYNYLDSTGTSAEGKQHAMLFVKGVEERHDKMQISSAPIAHSDYPEAYMRLLDGADSSEVFDYKEGDYRERRYLFYYLWDRDHMDEYIQTGRAESMETLVPTGNKLIQE